MFCGCGTRSVPATGPADEGGSATGLATVTGRPLYVLRAGGPHSYVGITNTPDSNPVTISLATWAAGEASFSLSNAEPHAILLWNVRVQVRSTGPGTDGSGWDTVSDDYPRGTPEYNSALYRPGALGEFRVQPPAEKPWRVCIIYSTDWNDSGNSYSGNYEVISHEIDE